MKLLVQPGDGVEPLVKAINEAESNVKILIFRFDRVEVETALKNAVQRGVAVYALIAHTNRGGETRLRSLEMRLLAAGVTVSRTASDLIRYHGKMMIVDSRKLFLLAFNFTRLDIESSRSFALITEHKSTVKEAEKLFDADSKRLPYESESTHFVVSPLNSRPLLSEFIKSAKSQLLIYDPAVTDPSIMRLLNDRVKAGVQVRLLGRLSNKVASTIEAHELHIRLHTRMMIRDGKEVFLGSQSLRTAELDARREIGLIFTDEKITERVLRTFEHDWRESQKVHARVKAGDVIDQPPSVESVAKKVAKAIAKELQPVTPVLEVVVKEMAGAGGEVEFDTKDLEETVKNAVKNAVRDAVAIAVEQAGRGSE